MKLAYFSIRNNALAGDSLPERIKILGWGDHQTVNAIAPRISPRTFAVLPQTQARKAWDQVALDYEHNTVPGSRAYKESGEPRDVAAYGTPEVIEGEGLFLTNLVYTPSGRAHAASYIDLSPAVLLDEQTGDVLGLHSCALTRNGAIEGIHFFNVEGEDPRGTNHNTGDNMDPEAMQKEIAALKAQVAELTAALEASKKPVETFGAKVTALGDELATFRAEVAEQNAQRDKQVIVERAAAEGKVLGLKPEVLAKFSVDELEEHVKGIKPTVPLKRFTPEVAPIGENASVIEQYNAIEDPAERATFYRANKEKF